MPDNKIHFNYLYRHFTLKERSGLKAFLQSIFKKEKQQLASLSYVFCSNSYLRKINKDFLQHNYNTDIVTFDLSDSAAITGEVYISIEQVRLNAAEYGSSFNNELHRVIFHGALHLCGYGDKTPSEQKTMRAKEDFYLNSYFS